MIIGIYEFPWFIAEGILESLSMAEFLKFCHNAADAQRVGDRYIPQVTNAKEIKGIKAILLNCFA